jgi:hypothetical protein
MRLEDEERASILKGGLRGLEVGVRTFRRELRRVHRGPSAREKENNETGSRKGRAIFKCVAPQIIGSNRCCSSFSAQKTQMSTHITTFFVHELDSSGHGADRAKSLKKEKWARPPDTWLPPKARFF